jgi:hypothetical protein
MPSTPNGKARSRLNSFRHGLCATDDLFLTCLTNYERRVFQKFRTTFHRELNPRSFEEKLLVDRIAVHYLRQFRLYRLEYKAGSTTFQYIMAPNSILFHLDRFSRYDWRINRQIDVLKKELNKLIRSRTKKSPKPIPQLN